MESRSQLNVTVSRELHAQFKQKTIEQGVCMNKILVVLIQQYLRGELPQVK